MRYSTGFMNDSTYMNASDPNSMKDQGGTRNAVYNVRLDGVPSINDTAYSKAIGVNNPEVTNNTFYAFGAKHTNIRSHLAPEVAARQRSIPQTAANAKLLDKKFRDVKMNTLNQGAQQEVLVKPPNAVMNDYTKNISQSIFTPGVY